MEPYNLDVSLDANKVFVIKRSELDSRIDPIFYGSDLTRFNKCFLSVKLSSVVCSFKSGIGAGKQDQAEGDEGIIQIRPTNIDNFGNLKFDKNVYLPYGFKGDKLKLNDVLFNNTNSQELVGKTAILLDEKELFYSNHITKIVVDKSQVLPLYIWIILNIYQENKIFYALCTNWNNQSGIGLELLKSLPIPLPPKEIQQKIVGIYNTAYAQKQTKEAKAKELLASIDTYLLGELGITLPEKDNSLEARIFTTNFSEVVGGRFDAVSNQSKFLKESLYDSIYPIVRLKSLVDKIRTGTTPHNSLNPYVESGVPFLRNTNLQDGDLVLEDIKYIDKLLANSLTYSNKDEIIVCIAGTVGDSALNNSETPLAINQNISSLRIKDGVNINYLNYYFNTDINIQLVKSVCSVATILYLNNTNLLNIKIPFPPLAKQNEIAEHIATIRTQAKALKEEAEQILTNAKQQVEQIILG